MALICIFNGIDNNIISSEPLQSLQSLANHLSTLAQSIHDINETNKQKIEQLQKQLKNTEAEILAIDAELEEIHETKKILEIELDGALNQLKLARNERDQMLQS